MEKVEVTRRKVLQTAVAALCMEAGYLSVEKNALGALTEATQSFITELGRTARMYSELALRTEPTVLDVQSALLDSGISMTGLSEYSKRPQRRHLPKQPRSYPQPPPRCLQVGSKVTRASHIPQHLPLLPDPHTYIKTPTFSAPASDYKIVREKLAREKRNSRKALSTILSKTRPSQPIAGTSDPSGVYTVVISQPSSTPPYMQALLPSPEEQADSLDKIFDSQDPSDDLSLLHSQDSNTMEQSSSKSQLNDSFENPFLRSPKRVKVTTLVRPS